MMNENRMGTERVPTLLLKMAVPVVLSTFVQSLYSIVDDTDCRNRAAWLPGIIEFLYAVCNG